MSLLKRQAYKTCSLNLYTFGLKYVILSILGLIELLKFSLRASRTSIAEYV